MRRLYYLIALWCGIVLPLTGLSQSIVHTVFNTERNLTFQKAVNTSDRKLLMIYGRERWLSLCDYLFVVVHNNPNAQERTFKIQPDNNKVTLYFKDAIATPQGVWFVFFNYIKVKNTIEVILVPFDDEQGKLNRDKAITLTQIDANDIFNGDFYLFQSPTMNQLGVLSVSGILDNYQRRFTMNSINLKSEKINFTLRDNLPGDIHTYQLIKPLIDNQGAYYVLAKRYKEAGAELTDHKPNYYYLLEHFENNVIRRSTGLMTDENSIVRYPDAKILNDSIIAIALPVSDTSLIHPIRFFYKTFNLFHNTIEAETTIQFTNNEPRINSSFITDILTQDSIMSIVSSGQYLEEVAGARLTHAYDIIKTYTLLIRKINKQSEVVLLLTPARLREEQDFFFRFKDELDFVCFSPGSSETMQWCRYDLIKNNFVGLYPLHNNIWKKNLRYYFLECNGNPILMQNIGSRYQFIYLP